MYFCVYFLFPSPTIVRIWKAKTNCISSDGLSYAGLTTPKSQILQRCHFSLGLHSHRGSARLCTSKSLKDTSHHTTATDHQAARWREKTEYLLIAFHTNYGGFFHTTKVTRNTFRIYGLLSKKKIRFMCRPASSIKSQLMFPHVLSVLSPHKHFPI